jgi:hypothetical protein
MTEFLVSWKINLDADSPQEAAQKALDIQRDPTSIATVFKVVDLPTKTTTHVDLTPEDGQPWISFVNKVMEENGGFNGEHPDYDLTDWRLEVQSGDTRLSYWEWAARHVDLDNGLEKVLMESTNDAA